MGLTVNGVDKWQPVAVIVNIILAVPAAMAVTRPLEDPTVATDVLSDDHVPPEVISSSVVVWFTHKTVVPVIGDGSGLRVIGNRALQNGLSV